MMANSLKIKQWPATGIEADERALNLKRRAMVAGGPSRDALIADAEQKLAMLGPQFLVRLDEDIKRLFLLHGGLEDKAGTLNPQGVDAMFALLHELRGEAGSFGYPVLSAIADRACKFIERAAPESRKFAAMLEQYITSLRVLIQCGETCNSSAAARSVMKGLAAAEISLGIDIAADLPA